MSSAQTDKTYPARVFAEMLIRDAKKQKHAPTQSVTVPGTTNFYNMLHGHGPMFESELVAYRVYFNQKQTVDPYGKFKKGLEIKESGFYPNGLTPTVLVSTGLSQRFPGGCPAPWHCTPRSSG